MTHKPASLCAKRRNSSIGGFALLMVPFSKVKIFFPSSDPMLDSPYRFCLCDRLPPDDFFYQPLRGLSVCKQLMLSCHFQFLHENHFSVSGYSATALNRGRSVINKESMVSLLFFPHPLSLTSSVLALTLCCCPREQEFTAC